MCYMRTYVRTYVHTYIRTHARTHARTYVLGVDYVYQNKRTRSPSFGLALDSLRTRVQTAFIGTIAPFVDPLPIVWTRCGLASDSGLTMFTTTIAPFWTRSPFGLYIIIGWVSGESKPESKPDISAQHCTGPPWFQMGPWAPVDPN